MKKEIEIDFSNQIKAAEECDCGTCSNEECGCPCHTKSNDQDAAIKFSSKVVDALTSKAAEHNSNEENSTTSFEELLDSFRCGAAVATYKGLPITELALARVNLLLRVKSGHFHDVVNNTNNPENVKKTLSGLIFEDENDSIFNNELDMFASWSPQETDFEKAREDMEKFGLNNEFKNIDELYLDKYEQIPLELD